MPSYLAKVALLAALYFLAGKLGLTLAVPPGYATIIWPPSGIAIGVLLLHGRGLAPGVFLGSFLLNATVGHSPQDLPTIRELVLATGIAAGSMLQALVGRALIVRGFGLPIRLRQLTDVLRLMAVALPLTCLVSATVGVASLYAFGGLPWSQVDDNWLTWWTGDMFGVLVFLPLTLVLGGRAMLIWRERAVRGLQSISLVLLVLPLGLTFIAWKSLSETSHRQSQASFDALAKESEQALHARLSAFVGATRSGGGIFQSSQFVSREEWRTFVEALRLREDYPGMLGLGWIEGGVVSYLEPEAIAGLALGTRIGEVPALRAAAERAAGSGALAITSSLMFGPDEEVAPGFLLLQPVYDGHRPQGTAEQRRSALRGFVFAPFQAREFFADLTPGQGRRIDVEMFEGAVEGRPLYGTRVTLDEPRFSTQREVRDFGAVWTLRWRSTLEFERAQGTSGAHFVLFGGLLFTGLFGVLLLVFGARRAPATGDDGLERPWILPLATFALVAGSSFAAYALLSSAEDAHVSSQVENETRRLEADLDRSVRDRLQVVRRVAHRWSSGGGTPYVVWRNDARDLVRQIEGLEQLQWIGPDYHLHWSEGLRRRGWVEGLDVRTDSALTTGLREIAERGGTFVTEPREISPGESAFVVYVPVTREGRFDGFIAATFTSRGFFGDAIEPSGGKSFAFAVQYGGVTYFDDGDQAAASADWQREGAFKVNDRSWTFSVRPTQSFVAKQHTLLPFIVLACGLLIAILSSFLVRYVLSSRHKTASLQLSAEALRASEERYELALRGMSVGLWDWNLTNNAVFLSPRCRDMLGIAGAGFSPSYQGFLARLHPEDRPRLEKMLSAHLKRQGAFDLEFRVRRDDGEYLWVHSYGQAQFDEQGFADRMAGSMQDITLKKQQEQQIERSGAQLRMLVENVPAAVAMFDREMRYLMTSRRWIRDYGLQSRDIIGRSHYEVFPEIRDMPRWIEIHQRAMRGEAFDIREDCWIRADGHKEWNQWAIHPWLDAEGNVGGIVMFTEVITARKLAEAAIRSSEAMNRAAMDKAPIGTALVAPDGRFLKVNPALCQLLGYAESELLARDFQAVTHPEDLETDLSYLRDLIDGRRVSIEVEKRYLHRDGRVIWAQLNVSAVRGEQGQVEFMVSHIQDITERKLGERALGEFISVVSSELRTPLAAIRDSLSEIPTRQDVELSDPLRRLFDACRDNCQRVGALVEEILDLEALAAGRMRLDFKDESIADITRQAVSVNAAYARIDLADIDPELMVYVDPARYGQALSNLLSNAARFSPAGSRIEVGAELQGDWVRVHVRDQGAGIPEEFRARIFGKFARHDHGGRQKVGAGLGLYITRQLVEQMRGRMGFVSQLGSGSTFWLEFPRVSRGIRQVGMARSA